MVRLGLRASDICNLRLEDFDWNEASIWVSGKGRRAAQMPLTQEIGDAVLAYLQSGRPPTKMASLFVRHRAPIRPFASSSAISGITAAAIHRAGIQSPCRGAHVWRHSAATIMLRHGVSLQDIGTVLRHRSLHATLQDAKVDTALLQVVVNPWPEVAS
jgi:integrase